MQWPKACWLGSSRGISFRPNAGPKLFFYYFWAKSDKLICGLRTEKGFVPHLGQFRCQSIRHPLAIPNLKVFRYLEDFSTGWFQTLKLLPRQRSLHSGISSVKESSPRQYRLLVEIRVGSESRWRKPLMTWRKQGQCEKFNEKWDPCLEGTVSDNFSNWKCQFPDK